MLSSAARTFISRAAASASSRGAVNRLSVQPSMMAARFGSVSLLMDDFNDRIFNAFDS